MTLSEDITYWTVTISYYAPMVLIPLSLALCIGLGFAKLPRTLMWLASMTLGYAAIRLGLIIALSAIFNRTEPPLPTRGDIFIGANLTAVNNAIGTILYTLQVVTLAFGFFVVMTYHRRNALGIIAALLGIAAIPFRFYFPTIQLRLHPNQAVTATWSQMMTMALLADAVVGVVLGYAIYVQRAIKQAEVSPPSLQ